MNWIKKCPAFFLLAVSGFIFTLIGVIGRFSVYKEYEFDMVKRPFLALMMEGAANGTAPWEVTSALGLEEDKFPGGLFALFKNDTIGQSIDFEDGEDALEALAEDGIVEGIVEGEGTAEETGTVEETATVEETGTAEGKATTEGKRAVEEEATIEGTRTTEGDIDETIGGEAPGGEIRSGETADSKTVDNQTSAVQNGIVGNETEGDGIEGNETENNAAAGDGNRRAADGEKTEEEGTYGFQTVTEDYFNDAAFIGDSRTVGLFEYGGIEERADFYAKISLTIYNVFTELLAKDEETGKKITAEEALTKKQYGKVYLMLGINELGTGTTETFMEEYRAVVERIRQLQPEAVIFVEGIMKVTGNKDSEDPIFNNKNIEEKNAAIAELADNRNIFYIDVNEAVCDGEGNLNAEYTIDEVHLKAKYYEIWKQFLMEHGIER